MLRIIRYLLLFSIAAGFLGASVVAVLFWYCSQNLPSLEQIESYKPVQINRVYADNGSVIGEFGKKKRKVVPPEEMPKLLLNAIVAAEDSAFFQHRGLDYYGILRAIIKNITGLRLKEGASTITQQVLKNFLLTDENKIIRKVKEAILVDQLESRLSKLEILGLYLNEIEFGNRSYGVCEGARVYFNKTLDQLDIGEIAYLAGVPQNQYWFSLNRFPERAKKRQLYVLRRMFEMGYIGEKDYEHFKKADLVYNPPADVSSDAPYAVDLIQRQLRKILDDDVYETGGLKIYTGINTELQTYANLAVRKNLLNYDKRHGYRALDKLGKKEYEILKARVKSATKSARKSGTKAVLAYSAEYPADKLTEKNEEGERVAILDKIPQWNTIIRRVVEDRLYYAVIKNVDKTNGNLLVDLGSSEGLIKAEDVSWATKHKNGKQLVKDIMATFLPMQLVVVKKSASTDSSERLLLMLEQVPKAQTAMVAIDPATRAVKAMSGGFSYYLSSFNRAVDALRQPGSSFKPFVYLTGIESGKYTPATIVVDEKTTFPNPGSKPYTPMNFSKKFMGPIRLRVALANSINVVAVKILNDVGVESVIKTARDFGIKSKLGENLSLALGSSEVNLLEMVNAYATFPARGEYDDAWMIDKVVSSNGRIIYKRLSGKHQVVDEQQAAIMISMMQSVVEEGSGRRAKVLKRPLAGKTGTTNDQRDAWFIGYAPQLVCGVWVGFDDREVLGYGETGSRAALPAFVNFMHNALMNKPVKPFFTASGLVHMWIDKDSGLAVSADSENSMMEVFLPGTEPMEQRSVEDENSKTEKEKTGDKEENLP